MKMESLFRIQCDVSSTISKAQTNFKKSPKDRITVSYVETRLELLETQWNNFKETHRQIISKSKPEDLFETQYIETDLFGLTEELYCEYKTILKDSLNLLRPKDFPNVRQISQEDVDQKSSFNNNIRLPKITIPMFSGTYSEWVSFRDLFVSLIHNNDSLDDVQKLHYLKSHLSGEALQLVRHIPITSVNYKLCWDQLQKRYSNKRYIVNCILKRFFNIRNVSVESSSAIKEMLDSSNECINALKNLNVMTENWDILLIYILCSKLDIESRKQWEAKICNCTEDLPTLNQFNEFLEQRFRSLEFCDTKIAKLSYNNAKSLHTSNITCPFCNESHKLYNCKLFSNENTDARRDFVHSHGLCYNCLGSNHSVVSCRQITRCRICKKRHHSLLHPKNSALLTEVEQTDQETPISTSETEGDIKSVTCLANNQSQILLATALVKAQGKNGTATLRSLLDQGSQTSFITESAVQLLGLKKVAARGLISGLGGDQTGTIESKFVVNFFIQSRHNLDFVVNIKAHVLNRLTSLLPERKAIPQVIIGLTTQDLADPDYNIPNKIDLLLGAEVYSQILQDGLIRGPPGSPIAQKTELGWILSGCILSDYSTISYNSYGSRFLSMHTYVDHNDLLRKFWEIESEDSFSSEKILTPEEQMCENIFAKTTKRDPNGRYIVKLPFRDEDPACQYGNSKDIAIKRFYMLENKLLKNPILKTQYSAVIDEYLELGHMSVVPEVDKDKSGTVYLPHHAVVREDKITTKVRVVFDASCVYSNGSSLNQDLLVGPTLQPDLRNIILRWRVHPICIAADIVKMYRQCRVFESDAEFQRIVWRNPDNPKSHLQHYKLQTVTFGTAAAPFLAVKALQQVAHDDCGDKPEIKKKVLNDFYVDDLLTGCQDLEEGRNICKDMDQLLRGAGFVLQKWCSNREDLFEGIGNKGKDEKELIELKIDNTRKILGLIWNRKQDVFQYCIKLSPVNHPVTKRKVVSDIARLFDPLGWISPVIIVAKILIQKLWISGIDWDDELPSQLLKEWMNYRENLNLLNQFQIPRWIQTKKDDQLLELHGFSDASNDAYAAVIYARIIDRDDNIHINLVASKTKVSPVKIVSIPRLELCGAVLLSKLLNEVSSILEIPKKNVHCWTDSTVVLAWLSSHPSRWKPFIANRVSTILTQWNRHQWSYVQSSDNPADCASRGISDVVFSKTDLWCRGPKWLQNKVITYNKNIIQDTSLEEKSKKTYHTKALEEFDLWSRYSSLTKLVRVVAYCKRFFRREASVSYQRNLSSVEMDEALNTIILKCQEHYFSEEIHDILTHGNIKVKGVLTSLNPFVDDLGILRVGGRLQNANIDNDIKHPVIIPNKSSLTNLLISNAHERTMHGGPQLMINYLRTKYWIIGLKNLAKFYVRKCVICVRYKAKISQQLMGQLPPSRSSVSRAFSRSGLDFAGPIQIRATKGRGHQSYKGYICLFICMATRAVHIEAVSDLTSQGFLSAFKRFVARRGHCFDLWSDNGTNFVGASRELKSLFRNENSSISVEIANSLASNNTNWHFIPPHAPNFGGLWEAGIKSAKYHLKRALGDTKLTFEELSTVLAQIEACLNSRPMSQVSSNAEDAFPLTPGHFLVGEPLLIVPDNNYEHSNVGHLRRWQLTQRMVQSFWRRWSLEYLTQFHHRYKWNHKTSEPNIGDVVLVIESDLPPARWLFGIITEKHPGLDGVTRVVSLRCKGNVIKRPVSKVCILPVTD